MGNTVYDTVLEQKCNNTVLRVCDVVHVCTVDNPRPECGRVPISAPRPAVPTPRPKCTNETTEHCRDVPTFECSDVAKQVPRDQKQCFNVPRTQCDYVETELCNTIRKMDCKQIQSDYCHRVPKAKCKSIEVQTEVCNLETKDVCQPVQRMDCTTVSKKVTGLQCMLVPKQNCTSFQSKQCKSAPSKECKTGGQQCPELDERSYV